MYVICPSLPFCTVYMGRVHAPWEEEEEEERGGGMFTVYLEELGAVCNIT